MAGLNIGLKLKYSFYSALVFFLVANPETYMLSQMVFGPFFSVASPSSGCPTTIGFFLHTFVFFIVMAALMMFPRDK
jgi:hypothetical protein